MKQLLSLLLCVCLLVNTVVPSFAQVLSGPVAKKGIVALFSSGMKDAALNRALFENMVRSGLEMGLYRETVSSIGKIHAQFEMGNLRGLGEQILVVPDASVREWMMHNEMAVLSLNRALTPQVFSKTISSYQQNLKDAPAVFKNIPSSETLSSFLQKAETAAKDAPAQKVLNVLANASSLALIGTQKDMPALLAFYEEARGTIFQDVAAVIVARGCLRTGAYEELNTFIEKEQVRGVFWVGLADVVQKHELPVKIPFLKPYTEEAVIASQPLRRYLQKAGPLVAIQGDFSSSATETWLELGKGNVPLRQRAAVPQTPKTQEIKPPLTAAANAPVSAETGNTLAHGNSPAHETEKGFLKEDVANGYQAPAISTVSVEPMPLLHISLPPSLGKVVAQGTEQTAATSAASAKTAVEEPEGLHENNVYEHYEEVELPPAYEAEDYVSEEALPALIPIAGEGFKFTLERGGVETILDNVDVSISSAIKLANGYNRLVQREDHIFEVRNQTLDPKKMERFFFALSTANGELPILIEAAQSLRRFYPLRIKINREDSGDSLLTYLTKPFKRLSNNVKDVVQIPIHSVDKKGPYVLADLDVSLLPSELAKTAEKGYLTAQGKRVVFHSPQGQEVTLSRFYVRLPKEESSKWTQILQNSPKTHFSLNVYPTENKTAFMTYVVSLLRVGTGKIFGPIMRFLGLPDWSSTAIPLFANNGMSLVLGPAMPLLRRMGDANMYRLGVGLYALSSLGALSLGFNGFLGLENAAAWQIGGFIGVLFGMGIAGTLVNTVNNPLLASNAGKITLSRKKSEKRAAVVRDPSVKPTLSFLGQRAKEVVTAKNVEMRNSVIYQLASAMKNVTTFLFAAWPFLFNLVSEAVGSSVRADFSLSFWFLSGISLYSLFRVLNLPLKDSFPRNLPVLHRMSVEKEAQVIEDLTQQLAKNPQATIDFAATVKQLNSMLGPYARQTAYIMKEKEKEVSLQMEAETIEHIQKALEEAKIAPEAIERTTKGLQEAFDSLGRRNANMRDVLKKPLVLPALTAMTLLTIHELGTSSEFAFAVNDALKARGMDPKASIAMGTFLSALFLYAPSFIFRLAGNWLALRMSEGSMYALSSSASVIGTGLMIASGGSLPMLFTGALFATFGMGNFFSQVYEYIMSLQPKYRTELAVLIGYTMPVAAVLTAGVRSLAAFGNTQGIYGLGLMACEAALIGSFFAAPGIFAGSSVIQSIKYYWKKLINFFKGGRATPLGTSPAAAQ